MCYVCFPIHCAAVPAEATPTLSFDGAIEVLQNSEGADFKETTTLDKLVKALNVIERNLEEEGVCVRAFYGRSHCSHVPYKLGLVRWLGDEGLLVVGGARRRRLQLPVGSLVVSRVGMLPCFMAYSKSANVCM